MHCAFDEYQKERQQDSQLDEIVCANVITAIKIHKRAIESFVHLMHIEEKRAQFIASALILLGDILYIFCGNLACQRLMDHSRDIFIKT
ncbi:hypothetical protein KM043_002464 [Ampulex compressa]|nr:hypothetical protein KM043_002464 [Ampulex compressa]